MSDRWRIAVDVGGTFTDAVGCAPDGSRHRCKIPSAAAARGDDLPAPIAAARTMIGLHGAAALPPIDLRVGTTRGTNALLEGNTSRVLMVVPEGLADILEIRDQRRPDLFAWHPVRPRPPLHAVVTTRARLDARGLELVPLDRTEMERVVAAVQAAVTTHSIDAIGIALLHADIDPRHEATLAKAIRAATGLSVSASHEMGRVPGFVERAGAAQVDALLMLPMAGFVASIRAHLTPGSSLLLMTSAGGLATADDFQPKDCLLSGPAGGVRGALTAARARGLGPVLAFDMGGTSTDISRLEGEIPLAFQTTVAGVTVATPCTAIDTIAAGGGSIVRCVAGAIRIGPESAGSVPGPACMGRGGPLTLTDLNLLAGRLEGVPLRLDRDAARLALGTVRRALEGSRGAVDAGELVQSCLGLADESMAAAIRRVAVKQGYEPSTHTLLAFGGAGPLHACAIAERLGVHSVFVPPDAGLLSACGIQSSVEERFTERGLRRVLGGSFDWVGLLGELAEEAGARDGWQIDRVIVLARLEGQESSLAIEFSGVEGASQIALGLPGRFASEYLRTYTTEPPRHRAIEIESVRIRAIRPGDLAPMRAERQSTAGEQAMIPGPATINRMDCTVFVPAGWLASEQADGGVWIESVKQPSASPIESDHAGLLGAEAMSARLAGIAAEMGELLRRTAVSVNVKDRLDFSCSVLDVDGLLVANAPHLPVHLGSMGECVRAATKGLDLGPGDAIAVNHPAFGGSHLPDITVITPVFAPAAESHALCRIGFVATRAHHAELGGPLPGSMPPFATRLVDEAVVIPPTLVRRRGVTDLTALSALLRSPPFPSRLPEENELDLLAQIAANERGVKALSALGGTIGPTGLQSSMDQLRAVARSRARAAIDSLPEDSLSAEERLDDGSILHVAIHRRAGTLDIDFSGSAAIHPRSFNAPAAVVRSVVMYVLRLIAGRERPDEASGMVLNEGFLDDVTIRGLGGMLGPAVLPGEEWPAVGAGNTETSQRLTDLMLKACRVCACSQGTMNNLLFGNERFGFYETIAGGAGGSPAGVGLSATHSHMTNTRVTDPEILERRLPVVLERFEIRRGSGGGGVHPGGDGVVRRVRFLEPVEVTLLTQHRVESPYGVDGGGAGACGRQVARRADGTRQELGGATVVRMDAGDAVEIQTPGGGGWGALRESPRVPIEKCL
ncbi:MAG: hydantoinase B/oxoprolinase family protein [Planctomycetota bacterium]|nr:hydantoinase B/oxoprolinase family protein [Planctomycetota bacterium]